MAIVMTPANIPSFWDSYRLELFKGSKQMFYKIMLGVPIAIPLVIMAIQVGVKIFSNVEVGIPSSNPFLSLTDLGSEGSFAIANRLMFVQFASIYGFILVIACALSVANEYRWNTIKMVATRQPSRIKLVLSKCLFGLSLVAVSTVSMLIGWFIWAMFLKFFYSVSLDITSDDIEAMGKGLKYFGIITLGTGIFALFAVAMTFLFKSVIGGIVGYLVFNALDTYVSQVGAQFANNTIPSIPEWAMPFLRGAQDMNPYLLHSSISRLTMQEKYVLASRTINNPLIITSNPVWLAWVMLAVYAIVLIGLALLFFVPRDIRD